MALTISGLAKAGGVGVETVRFYQRRGLVFDPRPRAAGSGQGSRHYSEEDVARLAFIRSAQAAGFTLEEIRELLLLDPVADKPRVRAMARERIDALDRRIDALDRRIAELQAARQALSGLARECERADSRPCPILAAFES